MPHNKKELLNYRLVWQVHQLYNEKLPQHSLLPLIKPTTVV